MKVINLLPHSERREIKLQLMSMQVMNFWIFVSLTLAVFFLLALAVTIFLRTEISSSNAAIEEKKKELSSSNTQQLESRVVALNNQIKAIDKLQTEHYQWSKALIEISRITPEGARLNVLDMNRATGRVEVAGSAETRDQVIEFWSNVKKSGYFRNINFPFSNLERESKPTFTYTFYLNAELLKDEGDN